MPKMSSPIKPPYTDNEAEFRKLLNDFFIRTEVDRDVIIRSITSSPLTLIKRFQQIYTFKNNQDYSHNNIKMIGYALSDAANDIHSAGQLSKPVLNAYLNVCSAYGDLSHATNDNDIMTIGVGILRKITS